MAGCAFDGDEGEVVEEGYGGNAMADCNRSASFSGIKSPRSQLVLPPF